MSQRPGNLSYLIMALLTLVNKNDTDEKRHN